MTTSTTGMPAYKLLEIAAAGTFGTVCIVRNLDRGTLLALKVLKEAHLNRPRIIARTRDEAAMLSQLRHPNIVEVFRLENLEGRPVVAMEWVRGLALEAVLAQKPQGVPPLVAVQIVRRCTLALGAAYHASPPQGGPPMRIIHRDIKPSNVLMSVDGEVKMVDFGIAHGQFEGKEAKTLSMVLGARGYLAPERLDGYADKPSCDVYSLGVMLYELLTGAHVMLSVHRDYHAEALQNYLDKLDPPRLPEGGVTRLRSLVGSMVAYDEALRPSHEELAHQLSSFLNDFGGPPNMTLWARSEVLPMFRKRRRPRPIDHPAYPQLAFLERTARMVKFPAPPDVDQEIRIFLRQPDWTRHLEELDLILTKNPHWSEAPFLEKLPTGKSNWWKFWGAAEVDESEIVAILRILTARPTEAVIERAELFKNHSDPRISAAAQDMLFGLASL
ncbi:MAG: serine/threonine-protein kinase [Myxococcota bacterium]